MLSCMGEQLACSANVRGGRISAERCSWSPPQLEMHESLQAAVCLKAVAQALRLGVAHGPVAHSAPLNTI